MERERFEPLALSQLDAVYRMAMHLARNPDTADEVVQDVYARAFRERAMAGFEVREDDPEGSMRAWLFTITHNAFYTRAKKSKRDPQQVEEFFAEESGETLPDEAPPAWSRAELDWQHVDGTLKKAIEELKPEFREVLMMWGVDGLKYREIAEILEVPIGTIMSRLHRARKLLADRLMGDDDAVRNLGLSRAPVGDGAKGLERGGHA